MDKTKTQISLTLWEDDAQNFDHSKYLGVRVGEIIAVKGAELTTFNGRSLSASFDSIITFQLDKTGDESYNQFAKKVWAVRCFIQF